jgi:hypothetical protein
MSDQQLMDYFDFDTDDLYSNQNNRLTEKQRQRLTALEKSRRRTSTGLGIFLMLLGLGGPIIAIVAGLSNDDPGFRIGFGIGFGLVWPVVWGGIGYLMVKSARQKRPREVASVRGRANILARESQHRDSDGRTTTRVFHELHIGGQTFGVNRSIADVIFQGDEYILYYVAATRDILSVEPISKSS